MHRQPLLNLLRRHISESRTSSDAAEQAMARATIAFVEQHPDCFERSLLVGESTAPADRLGHVTGSAWIVSPDRQQVVLVHHRKLDRWLQPGGHADGDPDVAAVALREAREETGLASLRFVETADPLPWPPIFDVDVHLIPDRGEVPEHWHYDIRFLIEADPAEPFGISDEVKNIRWISSKIVKLYTNSDSIWRMTRKILQN